MDARALRILRIVAALSASPLLAHEAGAQAAIRVGATVTAPIGLVRLDAAADSAHADRVLDGVQCVHVKNVGGLQVQAGEGAVVRVRASEAPRAAVEPRIVHVVIDFVGS